MTQPIAEGECIILLDPEDDKEFLYRMREKGHINLHKGKILRAEDISLRRSDLRGLVYSFKEKDTYEIVLH